MREYKKHITSLKGIACLFIMLGHYVALIKYAQAVPMDTSFLDDLRRLRLFFLVDEQFWLDLFFLVSGYLCARTSLPSLLSLIAKSVCRFLRFALPLFFACAIILLMSCTIGFHNAATAAVYESSWFQTTFYAEKLDWLLWLKAPFHILFDAKCYFNAPYWVLREMFLASIMIYACTYIKSKFRQPVLRWAVYLVMLAMCYRLSKRVGFYCMVGMGLSLTEEVIHRFTTWWMALGALVLSFAAYLWGIRYGSICFFSCLILFLPKVKPLKLLFEHKIFLRIGQLSFGIYSFHWPVMCSLGSLLLIHLHSQIGFGGALLLASICSALVTGLISLAYNATFEKWSGVFVARLQKTLLRAG